jgi:putative FmdB family regulatory protein
MPLYEYACEKCGQTFEVMQKFSDEPLSSHENCGGQVQRLISAPALQFKGSGWYITDYAKDSKSEMNGPAAAKTDGSGEKSSDSKPASGGEKNASSSPTPTTSGGSSETK